MRLHTPDGEVLVMEARQFEEILDLQNVLNAATADDLYFESQSLRRTASWWRNTMLPLLPAEERASAQSADVLVQAMENVAGRLERLAMTIARPRGSA